MKSRLLTTAPLGALLAIAPSATHAAQAYISFSGGEGAPFSINIQTPIRIDFASDIPLYVAIGFTDVGYALDSRGVSGLGITMNGNPTLYAGFIDPSTNVGWNQIGVIANNASITGAPDIEDLFFTTPMLFAGAIYRQGLLDGTNTELNDLVAASEAVYGNGHAFTEMLPVAGSYLEIAPGSFSTNTGITLNMLPADGWYDVFIASAITSGVIADAVVTTGATSIPEPSSFAALAGLATLGLAATRRRRA